MTGSHKSDPDVIQGLAASRERVRMGRAGWNIPRTFYANFVSQGTHLERYAQTFSSCEINSSFYRPHKPETFERWSASVPAGFQFSVKAPTSITHEAELNCSSEVLSAFLQQIYFLRQRQKLHVIAVDTEYELRPASCRSSQAPYAKSS
jgi:uncharacterized protein YecE (DUF72 family)